jgi:hypothetical protein
MDNNKTYTQQEFLTIMQEYNTMDRKIIKSNLKDIKVKYNFENADIIRELGFKLNKVTGWFNKSNPVIPNFIDMLQLCTIFGFSIEEVIQTREERLENNYIYSL